MNSLLTSHKNSGSIHFSPTRNGIVSNGTKYELYKENRLNQTPTKSWTMFTVFYVI